MLKRISSKVLQAITEVDLSSAFSTLVQRRVRGLVISADTFFSSKSIELAALASRHAVPTISPYREFVEAGGLMSYGARITDLYRMVGVYTGRILKGEKPEGLPVQQATNIRRSWSSISRPPWRSASKCQQRCSPAPTR